MQNLVPDSPPPSSSSPPSPPVQAEIAAQLRSASLALRDTLFELQETTTRLGDVVHNLHALVRKIEADLAPPEGQLHG